MLVSDFHLHPRVVEYISTYLNNANVDDSPVEDVFGILDTLIINGDGISLI